MRTKPILLSGLLMLVGAWTQAQASESAAVVDKVLVAEAKVVEAAAPSQPPDKADMAKPHDKGATADAPQSASGKDTGKGMPMEHAGKDVGKGMPMYQTGKTADAQGSATKGHAVKGSTRKGSAFKGGSFKGASKF